MEFTVAYVNPPKPGKKLANVKTPEGMIIGFDPAKFNFQVGKSYDCTVSESEYQGKTYHRIESQKEIKAPAGGNGSVPGIAPFWLPFASNTVAHAIMSGLIKEPTDIKQWYLAVQEVAEGKEVAGRQPGEDEFGPEIPY